MAGTIQIVGVYPVDTDEPVHLVEVLVTDDFDNVDWPSFTQTPPDLVRDVDEDSDPDNEAVPHGEQPVEKLADGRTRVVFFYHDLDVSRPLSSECGDLQLPSPTARPARLAAISYGPPF